MQPLTITGVPGLNDAQNELLWDAARAAGYTMAFAIGAGVLGMVFGSKTASVLYSFGTLGYGILVAERDPMLGVGMMTSSLVTMGTMIVMTAGKKLVSVTRAAGELPTAVGSYAPLPYKAVGAWG